MGGRRFFVWGRGGRGFGGAGRRGCQVGGCRGEGQWRIGQLVFSFGQEILSGKIGSGDLMQEHRPAFAIRRIADVHADIFAFQEFIVA